MNARVNKEQACMEGTTLTSKHNAGIWYVKLFPPTPVRPLETHKTFVQDQNTHHPSETARARSHCLQSVV